MGADVTIADFGLRIPDSPGAAVPGVRMKPARPRASGPEIRTAPGREPVPPKSEFRIPKWPALPLALLLLAVLCTAAPADPPKNLLKNGDFEAAEGDHPAHWMQWEGSEDIVTGKVEFLNGPPKRFYLDNLTCFWVDDPLQQNGKCLKEDSDVLLDEFRVRREAMQTAKPPPPRPKTPTKKPGYDTVGGTEGVHFYSEFLDIKPNMKYTLSVDFLPGPGAGAPKLWIKAYKDFEGWKRVAFKKYIDLKGASPKAWKTYAMTFNPTKHDAAHEIKWMRVDLYSYWTPGTYYYDNVKLVEAGEEAPPAPKKDPDDEDE